MRKLDLASLLLLSAVWGGSYLFMRVAAPEFGPLSLMLIRTGGAALCLAPLFISAESRALTRRHARSLLFVGVANSALPFSLLAFATLTLEAGFTALLNATTPLFSAIVAAIWLGQSLNRYRVLGLAIGFAGVGILVWDKLALESTEAIVAIAAVLVAASCYGIAGNFTKLHLAIVPPAVIAAGSMLGASVVLLPFGVLLWPNEPIAADAWGSAIGLAVACTAFGFLLYYRLIARSGAVAASTVTFLVPIFAALWGMLFLSEGLTWAFAAALVLTLCGTSLVAGILPLGKLAEPAGALQADEAAEMP